MMGAMFNRSDVVCLMRVRPKKAAREIPLPLGGVRGGSTTAYVLRFEGSVEFHVTGQSSIRAFLRGSMNDAVD